MVIRYLEGYAYKVPKGSGYKVQSVGTVERYIRYFKNHESIRYLKNHESIKTVTFFQFNSIPNLSV